MLKEQYFENSTKIKKTILDLISIKNKIEDIQEAQAENHEIKQIVKGITNRIDLLLRIFYINKTEKMNRTDVPQKTH